MYVSTLPVRKPLLPTPDAMTKVERRQLFEAQVRAQDEMNAEIQRQHDEYVKQMYEQDPNYQPQFDPNLAQFMQQEQGQYPRHVGGGCRGGGVRAGPHLPAPVRPQPGAVHAAGTRSVHGWGV